MEAVVPFQYAVLGAALIVIAFGGFGYLMLRAAEKPAPTLIIIATAVITALALIGYAFKPEAGELAAIAAAGIGSLAGSVSALFARRGDDGGHGRGGEEVGGDSPSDPG